VSALAKSHFFCALLLEPRLRCGCAPIMEQTKRHVSVTRGHLIAHSIRAGRER
jgi:hypothetical protein